MARTRRKRSSHPGVVLLARRLPVSGTAWRARFRDPDTGRTIYRTLDPQACSTADTRKEFAVFLSRTLANRRTAIACGAPTITSTPFVSAVASYFATGEARLRPATLLTYRESVALFTDWAKRNGLRDVEAIAPAHLSEFRETMIARRATKSVPGRAVGTKVSRTVPLRPASVNHHLRAVSAFLNWARRLGKTPRLNRDTIAEGLARLAMPAPQPTPLTTQQVRDLIAAAMRHDGTTWALTRAEHAADAMAEGVHRTPRYRAVAPLVVFSLLTGCRIGEAIRLRWSDVDLNAPDADRNPVGEVRLDATATKTHTARRVGLEVAPRLRALLATMKLRARGEPFVFGGAAALPQWDADNARDRLVAQFGAPAFTFQRLRQTAGTFLTNAPGIFGAASAFLSAKQLGHSVTIAERHYVGLVRGIPRDARTLDDAMQIADALDAVVAITRGEASLVALAKPRAARAAV
ncbi:MAG: tyrosine-type recombinase/integrase [Planctomycetes bacterium]|nr:tyrosine-type recombinase/integrase [Planctomycetota bacterium]